MKKKLLAVLTLLTSLALADQPDLFLPKNYDANKPLLGWVMSEKLDGVRGFWDGKRLLTRGGQVLNPPPWFLADYPPFAIDGELWTKRADFENISSIVRKQKADNRWRQITHQIFEVPNQTGGLLERLAVLKKYLVAHPNSPIRVIKQTPINNQKEVKIWLDKVVTQGAEGVVVRNPKTPYQTGRLKSAVKIKPYYDTECKVEKILLGKGKYSDKMGSILCETKAGKAVKIGSGFTDKQRINPPNIGDIITFKYYGFTKAGKFKHPVFLRIRDKQ